MSLQVLPFWFLPSGALSPTPKIEKNYLLAPSEGTLGHGF